jgi:hypothetical protein
VAGQPVRLVRCRHDACDTDTRIRLPWAVSAEAVRLVVCDNCHQAYACEGAVDESVAAPGGVRGWLSDPDSAAWKYLSIPIAAALVIGVLILIQSLS